MIVLNGNPIELADGAALLSALERVGIDEQSRGVAVAVDGEIVPRARWGRCSLRDGARVEALTAMQGG